MSNNVIPFSARGMKAVNPSAKTKARDARSKTQHSGRHDRRLAKDAKTARTMFINT